MQLSPSQLAIALLVVLSSTSITAAPHKRHHDAHQKRRVEDMARMVIEPEGSTVAEAASRSTPAMPIILPSFTPTTQQANGPMIPAAVPPAPTANLNRVAAAPQPADIVPQSFVSSVVSSAIAAALTTSVAQTDAQTCSPTAKRMCCGSVQQASRGLLGILADVLPILDGLQIETTVGLSCKFFFLIFLQTFQGPGPFR